MDPFDKTKSQVADNSGPVSEVPDSSGTPNVASTPVMEEPAIPSTNIAGGGLVTESTDEVAIAQASTPEPVIQIETPASEVPVPPVSQSVDSTVPVTQTDSGLGTISGVSVGQEPISPAESPISETPISSLGQESKVAETEDIEEPEPTGGSGTGLIGQ